jgi:hypothetical protein
MPLKIGVRGERHIARRARVRPVSGMNESMSLQIATHAKQISSTKNVSTNIASQLDKEARVVVAVGAR